MSLAALPLALVTTAATIATVVLVGGILLAGLLPLARALAGLQRRRTARWTGRRLPELYLPANGTLVARVESMLRDPATWRDLLWLWTFGVTALLCLLVCWVPGLAPRLANQQAGLSRSLLTPTTRAVRRAARQASTVPPSGHGLVGMRERVLVLGGTLRAGPMEGGGFEVVAELPLPAPDPDDGSAPGTVAP
jgi:Putative sensor